MSLVMIAAVVIGFIVIVGGFILDGILLRCKVRSLEAKLDSVESEFIRFAWLYGDTARIHRGEPYFGWEERFRHLPRSLSPSSSAIRDMFCEDLSSIPPAAIANLSVGTTETCSTNMDYVRNRYQWLEDREMRIFEGGSEQKP